MKAVPCRARIAQHAWHSMYHPWPSQEAIAQKPDLTCITLWPGHLKACASCLEGVLSPVFWSLMLDDLAEAVRVQQVGALIVASHDKGLRGTQDLAPALFDIVANGKNGIDVDRQAVDVTSNRLPVLVMHAHKALWRTRIGSRGTAGIHILD